MPLLETKGAASAQGFGGAGAGASGPVTYIEDVFSTYLYTGNGSTQTITNGIDLAGKGGVVWVKNRGAAANNLIVGADFNGLVTNSAAGLTGSGFNSFNSSGFSMNTAAATQNASSNTYVSWTFRKQPKFFDVVTYTGNGSNPRNIAHNLGSTPGCIIVKALSSAGVNDWMVYHIGLGVGAGAGTRYMFLNTTGGFAASAGPWANTDATATEFTVNTWLNYSGINYVAYIFAHNAGGFGLSGSDNVISCGYYSGNGSASGPVINLGYEPQWVMIKSTNSTTATGWNIFDNMRGLVVGGNDPYLAANSSDAETAANWLSPTATGFQIVSTDNAVNNSVSNYIYIAIRRGPMKVPTSGTSVFSPAVYTGNGVSQTITTNFVVDAVLNERRNSPEGRLHDRMRGDKGLLTVYTNAEATNFSVNLTNSAGLTWAAGKSANNAYYLEGSDVNVSAVDYVSYAFRRAPSFFDEVCYKGTAGNLTINHNLGVVPELIIFKRRDAAGAWWVWHTSFTTYPTYHLILNTNAAQATGQYLTDVISTSFSLANAITADVNASGGTYATYLFATCAGVSKVGSYTGTGALQTVNCGFTGGARFVLIKRTDSTGDWYVYDSARGISSGNDPYLFLNSTAAEVTGTNYVDTTSVGFQVTAAAPAGLNASGGSFVFLAIA